MADTVAIVGDSRRNEIAPVIEVFPDRGAPWQLVYYGFIPPAPVQYSHHRHPAGDGEINGTFPTALPVITTPPISHDIELHGPRRTHPADADPGALIKRGDRCILGAPAMTTNPACCADG